MTLSSRISVIAMMFGLSLAACGGESVEDRARALKSSQKPAPTATDGSGTAPVPTPTPMMTAVPTATGSASANAPLLPPP